MGVSKYRGAPKSSILRRFSSINHPFWGTPIFGNTHIEVLPSLKLTFSPLKIDGWKMKFLLGWRIFRAMLVSGRVYMVLHRHT